MDKEALDAVARMQAYIEENLGSSITLQSLARCAGYSPAHCLRLFERATGCTPFAYIRRLRLTRAAVMLKDALKTVLSVALDFDFGSHEGFTRAFARQFGITPSSYRRLAPALTLFQPRRVTEQRVEKGEDQMKTLPIFIQIVDRPARKALIRRGKAAEEYFAYCREVGCAVWDELAGIEAAIHEPCGMWLPKGMVKAGTSVYVAGVEVPEDYAGPVPENMELIALAPCRMMLFQGPAYEEEEREAACGGMWDAIQRYNPQGVGYVFDPEAAPRIQLAPMGYRGYIEMRPVKEMN